MTLPPWLKNWFPQWFPAVLAVAIALAYSNTLDNGFQLDDSYGLVTNPAIRELSRIPSYFVDPLSLTTLRANADYRPVLQITYAVNYAISEYRPWSWHLVNLALHFTVVYWFFAMGRLLIGSRRPTRLDWLTPDQGDLAAAGAALVYAVHPITSGCANYMWGRSSLLVAAFLMPATVHYLRGARLVALGLFVLSLFTKVEAISFLGIIGLIELLGPLDAPSTIRRTALRLAPFVAAAGAYMVLRQQLLPAWVEALRHEYDVTSYPYLLTQFRVWWLYVARLIAPLELITDDKGYTVSRSILEPEVLHALAGWLAVGWLIWRARGKPVIALLALWFFVHLAPHSSVAPLAEMHNEHRPYLASLGPVLLVSAATVAALHRIAPDAPRAYPVLVLALTLTFGALTFQRNKVWKDDLTFWGDIASKAHDSTRGQMNYGLALMARGRLDEAEGRFRDAIRIAPGYYLAHINLGIVRDHRGDAKAARAAFDEAVKLRPDDAQGYQWRGRFRARQGDTAGAIADYKETLTRDERALDARSELARLYVKQGNLAEARSLLMVGLLYDHVRFQAQLDEIKDPPPAPPRPPSPSMGPPAPPVASPSARR